MYATLGVSCGHVGGALTSNQKFFRLKDEVYALGPTQTSQYPVCNMIKHNQHGLVYEPHKASEYLGMDSSIAKGESNGCARDTTDTSPAPVVERAEPRQLVGGRGGIHPLAWSEVCKSCKSCPSCKSI